MAWEMRINGNIVSVETGDSIRTSYQRDVNVMGVPMTDEEWAMDMVTTAKVIRISGEVADGEGGKTLGQWFDAFLSLMPSDQFNSSNYLKILDAEGNTIKQFSPVVLENLDISLDSKSPTTLSYSLQVRVITEVY